MERLHQHRTVRKQRFGIRKVSTLGAVSALLGTAVFFSGGVQADQVTATQPQASNTETVVASPQETVSDTSTAATSTSSEAASQAVEQTSEVAVVAATSEEASTTGTSESASSVASTESVAASEAASATAVTTQETSEVAKSADTSATTQRSASEGLEPATATVAEEKASAGNEESSNPAVGVINYDKDKTTFDVAVVGNASTKAVKGARIAVWSADKGQDDLKWYTPAAVNNQIRQTINILDHAGTSDDYYVHVYTDFTDGTTYAVSLGTYHIDVPEPAKPEVKVVNYDKTKTTFDVVVTGSDKTKQIKGSRIAVWSADKDQDDIKWYTPTASNNQVHQTVDIKNHAGNSDNYYVHVYTDFTDGTTYAVSLGTYHIDVPEPAKPEVKVVNYDKTKTTFDVVVTGSDKTKQIKGSRIAVWSADKDQDDIKWYTPTASNNQVRQTVDIKNHAGNSDDYYVHVYTDFTDGTTYAVSLGTYHIDVPEPAKPEVKVVNYDKTKTTFDVVVTGSDKTKQIKGSRIAVWSADKDQDDVKWYTPTANNNQVRQTVDIKNHAGNSDDYYVHVYTDFTDGTTYAVSLGTYHIDVPEPAKPEVKVVNYDKTKTTFDVVVTGSDKTKQIKGSRIAVWSADKDQDDVKWYTPTANNNQVRQTVDIKNHAGNSDDYYVHVYTDFTDGTTYAVSLGTYHIDVPEPAKPEVKVVNYDKTKTTFDVVVTGSDKTKQIKGSRIAVWSADKDQDDVKWYTPTASNNQVRQTVDIKNHAGNSDDYYVHVYTDFTDGTTYAVSLGTYHIDVPEPAKPEVKVVNYDKTKTTFDVVVTGSDKTKPIKGSRIAVWSADKDQDDVKWYTPTANNNQVRQTVDIKNHAGNSDDYYVHVYTDFTDGTTYAVSLGTYHIDVPEPAKPEVKVVNYDKTKTTFDVVVTGSDKTKQIKGSRIAVWSADKDQDDVKWYTPTANNNQVRQTVDIKNHAGNSDDYYVHVYTDFTDGTTYAVSLGTYRFEVPKAVTATYKGTGNYELRATAVPSSGDILFAVWSDAKGQDDLKWYASSHQNSQAVTRINVTDHADTGTYHVHVYQVENGKSNFLVANTFTVDRVNYKTPYYRQRDPRWASKVYGLSNLDKTGCVPTSLAMVFSSLSGKEVLPTTVADYLYNNTDQFNKQWTGTGAVGLLKAVDHWGYTATPLPSLSAVATALQEGYHVMAAVQNDIFVRNGSHELVLKGYNNGKTYVSDPYTPMLSGWYPISQLWSEQSRYAEDRVGLPSTFIKITDI
ncbi:GBS Bsp-like repeat-containing protein [Streptococcus hyointestinalis]|uniref:GBS Bsp-like repeat-containing protein n=1 Tax=Streptococcus hyointestinalis TaxID=1337 RepID=UPI0013DF7FBE|nr:GBS Bsp-like repeat-containing protein [Streptococcus hyointestinalis]